MTNALSVAQRARLERLVSQVRRLLERDLAAELAGRYGIDADGTVAAEGALGPDAVASLAARREIEGVIRHLHGEVHGPAAAVSRLLREAVFTHLNRLVAIRIAEGLGLLPPSLAGNRSSRGFRDLLEAVPLLACDATGGYWTYLRLCGDELAADVPVLFDPRDPLLALAPGPGALDEIARGFADPANARMWTAPDCLGWVYQFFNSKDERTAMREESAAPRGSWELAVRNQFCTPRYVVDYLAQNSLGRCLIEADPASPLLRDLPLLIDPPAQAGESASLDEISVLDPACGSGNFLLGAYDLLERAWNHVGVSPGEAAPSIIRSLWGIDIDPRCVQVAAAAIVFRARQSCPEGALPRPNVVCARSLSSDMTGLERMLSSLPGIQRSLIGCLIETVRTAPVLGTLLKAEEEVTAWATAAEPPSGLEACENDLVARLNALARAVDASPAERLFATRAEDAIRFVRALRQRYDAVLMNPPFGEPVANTRPYLKDRYPWIPAKDSNLLAAFVGRGLELCKPSGYVGAITSRSGLFLATFADWRSRVLLANRLIALADLGLGVMEQAMVEAAAYVIGPGRPVPGQVSAFIRVLNESDRSAALTEATARTRAGGSDPRVFRVDSELRSVPGAPVAYWMHPSLRKLFTDLPPTEGHAAEVRQGLATGDDFRFVRAIWEVAPGRIARSRDETLDGRRWCPFAKGGAYSPYWADVHLVVDYQDGGVRLRGSGRSVIRNAGYFFRAGLTWPRRTQGGFNPSVLPGGCVFADKGPSLFARDGQRTLALLGWLLSRPAGALLASTVTFGSYEVGAVQRLPWPGERLSARDLARLESLAAEAAAARAAMDTADETTRRFVAPVVHNGPLAEAAEAAYRWSEDSALRAIDASGEIDDLLAAALSLDQAARRYLDEEMGPHVARYPDRPVDPAQLGQWFSGDAAILVAQASKMAARGYIADQRLELMSRGLGARPRRIVETRRRMRLSPPGHMRRVAEDTLSYLLGCVFGRWDIRLARDQARAVPQAPLFELVPACAPGMLTGPDGLPASECPDGYPLRLPPTMLVVDEPGHDWDVEAALLKAAAVLWEDPAQRLMEMAETLGWPTIRDYLRRDFFKSHLRRYTRSRRKAPVYWPLYLPSGAWGLWLYAATLCRETLFAVARAASDRLSAADGEIRRLQGERITGGVGRSAREVAAALGAEEKLLRELRWFRDEAEQIAALGWDPDLDDGIVLNAAPLAGIFPGWKDATAARAEIKAGKYPWAHVSCWAGSL
jgi:hypothetical protein